MTASATSGPAPWREAASRLATRVSRRARWQAGLAPLARALWIGAGLSLTARIGAWLPPHPAWVLLAPGAALLLALPFAARAWGRVRPVDPGCAAWALDRLAGTQERGLTAAVAGGAAAAEAALAAPALGPPPRVRLEPPRGVAWLAAGVLLTTAAALLSPAASGSQGGADEAVGQARLPAPAPALDGPDAPARAARAQEAQARALDERAMQVEQARRSLGLAPQGPVSEQDLTQRLDAAERRRLADALRASSATDGGDASDLEQIHTALGEGGRAREAAAEARRRASAARAQAPESRVPVQRRDTVARYLAALAQAHENGAAR